MTALTLKNYGFWVLLKQPLILRFFFCLFFLGTALLDIYIFPDESLLGLYFVCMIIAGLTFWNQRVLCFLLAVLSISLYYFVSPQHIPMHLSRPDYDAISMQLVAFMSPIIIIPMMIQYFRAQKQQLFDTISALVKALDSRDSYTAAHSENVAKYALYISKKMKLGKKECETIFTGGLLHDIGKIGIEEHILNKKGRLTAEEYDKIKEHPVIGYNTLKHIDSFQREGILDIVLYHHERYDGTGYPHGLKGKEIPLYARILCVADCLDAMTSKRVYREQLSFEQVLEQLKKNSGTQLDAHIVETLTDEPNVLESLIRESERPA